MVEADARFDALIIGAGGLGTAAIALMWCFGDWWVSVALAHRVRLCRAGMKIFGTREPCCVTPRWNVGASQFSEAFHRLLHALAVFVLIANSNLLGPAPVARPAFRLFKMRSTKPAAGFAGAFITALPAAVAPPLHQFFQRVR